MATDKTNSDNKMLNIDPLQVKFADLNTETRFKMLQQEVMVNNLPFTEAIAKVLITDNPYRFYKEVMAPNHFSVLPQLSTDVAEMMDILTQQAISTYSREIQPLIIPETKIVNK